VRIGCVALLPSVGRWLQRGAVVRIGELARRRCGGARLLAAAALAIAPAAASADSLPQALIQAYQNNPQLNAQRAAVRATDESVPQALSGYRPRVSLSASISDQYLETLTKTATGYTSASGNQAVQSYGGTVTQNIYNGLQTASRTRQAEQLVSAARETLRLSEQTILLLAATAYMNLIRDTAILDLQRRNVEVLQEQLRQTRDRFNVGEVTRTDVAQSESRLAAGRSQVLTAESNYTTSRSTYRQVVGVEPHTLTPASPVDRLSPHTLPTAVVEARARHPSVTTAMFNVDAALFQVKIAESALYPVLNLVGSASQTYGSTSSLTVLQTLSASVGGQLTVPVYQGGTEYATIRQAKETLTQRRVDLDTARDQAQQVVARERRPRLEAQRVAHAAQELDVSTLGLARAFADPEHVGRAVVPLAGRRIDPGQRLLVGQKQRLVRGIELGLADLRRRLRVEPARRHEIQGLGQPVGQRLVALALRRTGDEILVPRMHPVEIGIAALGEGAQQVQRGGRLVVGLDQALRVGLARGGVEIEAVDDVAAIGG